MYYHLKLAFGEGYVQKVTPWNPRIPCLQYVDDTIMFFHRIFTPLSGSRYLLIYIFELLSVLSINFHKSSLYQLGPPSLDLAQVSNLLHYKAGSYPFTNLGFLLKPPLFLKLIGSP